MQQSVYAQKTSQQQQQYSHQQVVQQQEKQIEQLKSEQHDTKLYLKDIERQN